MLRRRYLGTVAATIVTTGCTGSRGDDRNESRPDRQRRRRETLASRLGLDELDAKLPDWDVSDPEIDENTVTLSGVDAGDDRIHVSVTVYEDGSTAQTRYQQRREEYSATDEYVHDVAAVDIGDEGFQYDIGGAEASVAFRVGPAVSVVEHRMQADGTLSEARAVAAAVESCLHGSDAASSE